MGAIYKKEIRNYFCSPIGYMYIAVFMCLTPMFFTQINLAGQTSGMSGMFYYINIVYIFLTAILTMGMIAEERNKHTDHLLLSAPLNITEIVLGKYLAAISVLGITVVLSLIYPVIIGRYGSASFGRMFSCYLGFTLLWMLFISIGMFISSLTESQFIAAVVTFGILFALLMTENFISNISNQTLANFITACSPINRFNDFQIGIVFFGHIIYFLSFTALFVFLTIQNVDRRRFTE
ncbi:MAG: ABC transporter permease [Clostridia bacterium]|nr:ABC transporter permease [Clostridia bacterium]